MIIGLTSNRASELTLTTGVRNITQGDADFNTFSAPDSGDLLEVRVRVQNTGSSTAAIGHDLQIISDTTNMTYQAMTTATLDDGMTVTDLLVSGFIPELSGNAESSRLQWSDRSLLIRPSILSPRRRINCCMRRPLAVIWLSPNKLVRPPQQPGPVYPAPRTNAAPAPWPRSSAT